MSKQKSFEDTSRKKFLALFAAPLIVIALGLLTFFALRMDNLAFEWAKRRAEGMAIILGTATEPLLDLSDELGNADSIQKLLSRLKYSSEFVYAAVLKGNGSLLAGYKAELKPPIGLMPGDVPVIWIQDNALHVVLRLKASGGTTGTLVVGLSMAEFKKEQKTNYLVVGAAAGSVVLLGLLFSILGRSFLLRRREAETALMETLTTLQALAQAARKVAEGNLTMEIQGEGDLLDAFREMLHMLRDMSEKAKQISEGNLSIMMTAKGDLADAFRGMVESLRELVVSLRQTALRIVSSGGQIVATSREQERGAVEQSTAVEETQRTTESLLESSRQVTSLSEGVLRNAESTHRNNQVIAERIRLLSAHTERIAEVLEIIKDIANKSELLALNASLEGTKAGEAGRGFSLVAAQMQRLSESVMESVADIKNLTTDIQQTTAATVEAINEGGRLAASTTESARQIRLAAEQQKRGTEQVSQAMSDISKIARQTVEGSKQSSTAIEGLTQLAETLQDRVDEFRLAQEESGNEHGPTR